MIAMDHVRYQYVKMPLNYRRIEILGHTVFSAAWNGMGICPKNHCKNPLVN